MVEQQLDPLARGELPAGAVPLEVALAAAAAHELELLLVRGEQLEEPGAVGDVGVGARGSTLEARTGTLYVIHESHLQRKSARSEQSQKQQQVDFAESTEHEMIRAAVRDLAAPVRPRVLRRAGSYGRQEPRAVAGGRRPWLPLRAPPARVRRWRRRHQRAHDRVRGARRARVPDAPAARHRCDLWRVDRTFRHRRAEGPVAPGTRRRARRWRSRSPSPTRAPTPTGSPPPRHATATSTDCAARRPTSPGSTRPPPCSSSHAPAPTRPAATHASRCSSSTPTAPGSSARLIPVEIAAPEKQFQLFFDDVQVPSDRLLGERARRSASGVLGPESRAHHRGGDLHRARPVRARRARRSTRASARCGTCRSGGTRASRTRSPPRRSSSSWRA